MIARQRGFTLLELLLALAIFAMIGIAAYAGLDSVLNAGASLREQASSLSRLQYSFSRLTRDLEQAADRPVRDAFGDSQDAFVGNDATDLMRFTRAGLSNPTGQTRSEFMRVAWRLDGDQLMRRQWPVLDISDDTQPPEETVAEGVTRMAARFLDDDNEWNDDWPPVDADAASNPLPRAVELVIELEGVGELTRLIKVAG